MTPRRTIRPARPEKRLPDHLADAVRAITRQAAADGQPLASPDARGLIRFLRYLGLESPELSPVAPVVGRLMAELLLLEAQAPAESLIDGAALVEPSSTDQNPSAI